jgi:hypothetical protein
VDAELVVLGHELDEADDLLEGGVPAPRLLEKLFDVESGADEGGIGLDGLAEPAEGVLDLALLGVDEADVVARLRVERLYGEDLGEDVEGTAVLVRVEEGESVLVHRLDPARTGLHRVLVLLERLLVLAEGVVGVAEVVVERGIVRVDLEAAPEDAHGLLGIAHRAVDAAEVVVGEDMARIELDGLRVGHLGALEVAGLAMGVAEGEEDFGVGRVHRDGAFEGAYRVLGLLELQVDRAHVEEGLDVLVVTGEDAREGREGLLGAVGAQVNRAQEEACLVRLGVLEEELAREALRRLEIPEHERGFGPVEELGDVLGRGAHHCAVLSGRAVTSRENSPALSARELPEAA